MIDRTAETLSLWRSVPFSYALGQDCLMSLADHVQRVTGQDYGAVWRGRYLTESEAWEHVKQWGGPVAMVDASRLPATDKPTRDDILIARVEGKLLGGLHTGDSIAFRLPRGVAEIRAKLIQIEKAWKVQ